MAAIQKSWKTRLVRFGLAEQLATASTQPSAQEGFLGEGCAEPVLPVPLCLPANVGTKGTGAPATDLGARALKRGANSVVGARLTRPTTARGAQAQRDLRAPVEEKLALPLLWDRVRPELLGGAKPGACLRWRRPESGSSVNPGCGTRRFQSPPPFLARCCAPRNRKSSTSWDTFH